MENVHQHSLPSPQALTTVERYDGFDDAHAWLQSMNTLAVLYHWPEDICLQVARLRLKGPAQRWIARRRFDSWDDIQQHFLRRFGETRESALARLNCCSQGEWESPKAFADRFLELADTAGRLEDEALVLQFLSRLRPELRKEAARRRPQSIDEIVEFCIYWLGAMSDEPAIAYQQGDQYSSPCDGRHSHNNGYASEEDDDYSFSYRNHRTHSDGVRADNQPFSKFKTSAHLHSRPARHHDHQTKRRWNDQPPLNNNQHNRTPGGSSFDRSTQYDRHHITSTAQSASAMAPKTAMSNDIETLTKSFQRLELTMNQLMQDKDKEIRHLRYALQQHFEDQAPSATPQFNYLAAGHLCISVYCLGRS